MLCANCRYGNTISGKVAVTLLEGNCTVIVNDVPADICSNCGEYYLSAEMTAQLLDLAQKAAQQGAEVEILRFAA